MKTPSDLQYLNEMCRQVFFDYWKLLVAGTSGEMRTLLLKINTLGPYEARVNLNWCRSTAAVLPVHLGFMIAFGLSRQVGQPSPQGQPAHRTCSMKPISNLQVWKMCATRAPSDHAWRWVVPTTRPPYDLQKVNIRPPSLRNIRTIIRETLVSRLTRLCMLI